jgi:diacylglycerol O-acyltransferase/trehalose O-mycolyltransferase
MAAVVLGTASATPAHAAPAGGYAELYVPSGMGPVKVQVQWAARGGHAALYLLDGMHAENSVNGWVKETDALRQFVGDDITLVLPVGGEASFYTDWYSPSALNGQRVTYRWETFLTKELPAYLAQFGVSPHDDAIVGLSMGGSAALALAAYHRDQFRFAGSLSGFPDLCSPGMPTAVRMAMLLSGGYDATSMWGPPFSPAWLRNDPSEFAPKLRGLFIAAGSGMPGPEDRWNSVIGVAGSLTGFGLEALSRVNTLAFQATMQRLGIPATWDLTPTGVHEWGYWQTELAKARPQILTAVHAG